MSNATENQRKVPFLDLGAQYAAIKDEIDAAIARVIRSKAFILGPEAKAFEEEFAAFTGFRHAIGVGNGTDALDLALRACELSDGAEVVAPTHTFVATTEAITHAGGTVRLADVDDTTFCLSAETLDAACTPQTRGVVSVPLYGNPAGLDEVAETARTRGLRLVVDSAQAHGATLHGKRMGELADVATYSFYPGKNLGAYGDAGAVATNDDEIARRVRMWRNHGRESKFGHEFEGMNSRLDGMQAAVLRAKLPHLDSWNAGRRRVAGFYEKALAGTSTVRRPQQSDGAEHVFHLYVARVADRDHVRKQLGEMGVATGVHYPDPVHLTAAYARLGHGRGAFPVAEAICDGIISLPIYPEMTEDDVSHVAAALNRIGA